MWRVFSEVALPNPAGRAGTEQVREAARDREVGSLRGERGTGGSFWHPEENTNTTELACNMTSTLDKPLSFICTKRHCLSVSDRQEAEAWSQCMSPPGWNTVTSLSMVEQIVGAAGLWRVR